MILLAAAAGGPEVEAGASIASSEEESMVVPAIPPSIAEQPGGLGALSTIGPSSVYV